MGLSAISQLLGFGPYVCTWFVARDLIAVALDWTAADGIAAYGWWALAFALASIACYFAGLMCTHMAAFRCATNMRKQVTKRLASLPLGFFDTHPSGALRRVVDGCAASTETLLAHMLPDVAGTIAMVIGMLALLFVFDWRLGLACLVAAVASLICLACMMNGKGMEFMKHYMGALVEMNKAGTEYVRGIPVVKVFQQTVYSFKAFHDSIAEYARMPQGYAGTFCRKPQVTNLSFLNGLIVFFLSVALLVAPGEADFPHFVANFAFYAIFSAVIPTAMSKLMFVSEASQMAGDSMGRVGEILAQKPLSVPSNPKQPPGSDVRFEDATFTYEGAERLALRDVSLHVPAGKTLALVGPSGGGKSTCASLIPRFWDVDEGRVLVGGVDVREMDPRVLMVCWPLAIAAFWSVPVAFAILFGTRKRMQPVSDAVRAEKIHVAEGIQETLECMREIRATNQTEHYLAGLFATIDCAERQTTKGELLNGSLVNAAFAVLRLGIATTLVAGASMLVELQRRSATWSPASA